MSATGPLSSPVRKMTPGRPGPTLTETLSGAVPGVTTSYVSVDAATRPGLRSCDCTWLASIRLSTNSAVTRLLASRLQAGTVTTTARDHRRSASTLAPYHDE